MVKIYSIEHVHHQNGDGVGVDNRWIKLRASRPSCSILNRMQGCGFPHQSRGKNIAGTAERSDKKRRRGVRLTS